MRLMPFLILVAFVSACGTLPPGPVNPPSDVDDALVKRQEENAIWAVEQLKRRKKTRRVQPTTPEVPWEEELRTSQLKSTKKQEQKTVDQMPTAILRPKRPDAETIPESEGKSEYLNKPPLEDSEHAVLHLYREGLKHAHDRNWDGAISAFDRFLKESPDHIYADRAAYWISHCHYMAGDHGLAIITSNQFEGRYPHSQRLAEMIYFRALSHVELGQYEEAVPEFRSLLSKFPASEWALDASKRLAEITVQRDAVQQDRVQKDTVSP